MLLKSRPETSQNATRTSRVTGQIPPKTNAQKTTLYGHPKQDIQAEQNQSVATPVEVEFLGSLNFLESELMAPWWNSFNA
jgi:hypothetical protein